MVTLYDITNQNIQHILVVENIIIISEQSQISSMQSQDNTQKAFVQQLKIGDYVDARYGDDEWKLAKIIQKQQKYVTLVFDGHPPNTQQTYITTMRIKPLRSTTIGYTGPTRNPYINIMLPILEITKYIQGLDTILKATQMPSPYKTTQYLRGQIFSNLNMLLMSDVKLQAEEITALNNFFIQFGDRVGKICAKVKEYLPEYFQSNVNNKLCYLTSYKLSLIYSLQQLLYLLNLCISQTGPDQPRLFKTYKSQLSQQNIYQNLKLYLRLFHQLLSTNDINGRWLPTYIRILLSKILIKYKQDDKVYKIEYGVKDYLQFYLYWPNVMMWGGEYCERKFVEYVVNVVSKQSTFDSKLKSLQVLRRLLEKQQKLSHIQIPDIIQLLSAKKVVDSLLKYFNPQIFKRYIPILKHISSLKKPTNNPLTLTQPQIDLLFKILLNSHQSQTNILYQIIVSISQFINIQTLDNIYMDIEKNIDINSENGIKFIKEFTIKAINNFNSNKSKGFFSGLLGRKKCSGKFGYYGLNLFVKEIMDNGGNIRPTNIAFVINNIGSILQNQSFHSQRMNYMQICIINIDKKQSYGQSVKLLGQIICTYPSSAYLGDSQESIVAKLDQKYKLVDCLIKGLKPLQTMQLQLQAKNGTNIQMKVSFEQSIKYCYTFLQQFNPYFKYPLQLRHINHLWNMPHIFQFLRKSKQALDPQIPSWKRKYYKKLSQENIKGIINEIISKQENILLNQECFDAIHQLILTYNLNKSIELTERATIRYRNFAGIVGIGFYFRFLEKLVKEKDKEKYCKLLEKVVKVIFEIYMRPTDYYAIQSKCQNWIKCLMKVIKTIYREYSESCIASIEIFLDMIKGKLVKDISNSVGKLDIVVAYEARQKTITLPKSSTILKLRTSIMQAFKIKYNFEMFNTHLKRQIKFVEEQDFSIYAMGQAIKGPTIIVKKVQQKQLYPQFQAYERFMNMIESEEEFYKIIFGILQKQNGTALHSRIWKIIDKVPVNRATMQKIKNCKDFVKKNWQQFLLPHRMEQLQYSINIVYGLLGNSSWLQDFKKTSGNVVVQQLYLTMLTANQPLSQKIKINLSKILLKILEHNPSDSNSDKKNEKPKSQQSQNTAKINMKIMQFLQRLTQTYREHQQSQKQQDLASYPSIQCINLMLKMLLTSSFKRNQPQTQILIKFFLHDQIILYLSDLILFRYKDVDTTFFTQDILEKIIFNTYLENSYKFQILNKFLEKYLKYDILVHKQSTQNYFIFLIDFLHSFQKEDSKRLFQANPQMVQTIKQYVYQTLDCQRTKQNVQLVQGKKNQTTDEMIHGCLKLLHDTLLYPCFAYDFQKIFNVFLTDFVLLQSGNRLKSQQSSNSSKGSKNKLKYKKILYEIMKTMIYNKQQILNIFVQRVAPKLQTAQWRRNLFSSWNLQQQKKEKKFFCGLQNLAATCYINCLFQQLFMIRNFTDRFINIDSIAYKQQPQTNQIYQLQKLLTFLKYGNKRSYTTRQFCQSFITFQGVPIDPTVQNDADQFFNTLMEKIQTFLKLVGQHEILEETFQGKLSNQLNCEGCPHSSQKIQPFLSIGLDIKNKKTLQSALDGYVQGQILDGDNAYFCQICQKKVRTMKKMCIKQLPNIMVIVLKRFTYNFDQMRKIKINDELKFPEQLNMKKYMSEFHSQMEMENQSQKQMKEKKQNDDYYQYHLRGVVVHSGTSEGGHYYSFIKEEQQGKWYQFNDECIDQADYKRIEEDGFGGEEKESEYKLEKHKNAYILFYQKQYPNSPKNPQIKSQQPFQSQIRQLVQSQNRTADFLSIILDQNFIRLCENVGMCGKQKAHHFIILYFHSVLLRDKNRDQYLPNIYRIILTLLSQDSQLALWFLNQVDDEYIREFLIEAPKLSRYLCLGLVMHAIKISKDVSKAKRAAKKEKQVKAKIQPIQNSKQKELSIKTVKIQQKSEKVQQKTQQATQRKQQNSENTLKIENSQQSKPIQKEQAQQQQKTDAQTEKQQIVTKQISKQQSETKAIDNQQQKQNVQLKEQAKEDKVQVVIDVQKYNKAIVDLIPRLVAAAKNKGMCPFGKIFTYLGSIPAYRQELQKYQYAERVAQIITNTNNRFFNKIQYPSPQPSYIGRQHQSTKQKDLESNQTFLIQSLRYFPHILPFMTLQSLLSTQQSRPATKSLLYLLTKQTGSAQLAIQTIQAYKNALMDEKYKKEDVDKFMFLIRYYYLMCDGVEKKISKEGKKDGETEDFVEAVKGMCIGSVAIAIKSNQGSYLAMEIIMPELNKLAYKCQDFKNRWMQKVSHNQSLHKSLSYWLTESRRPHFLQRNQQWKRKTSNLSYQQKQILISQNIQTQERRTNWMLSRSTKFQKSKRIQPSEPTESSQQSKESQNQSDVKIPEIHSQLDLTEVGKNIVVGFREFKIVDRLGILTKVEDQKGLHRWAILQRSEIQTYIDF